METQSTEQINICLIMPPFPEFEGGDPDVVAEQFLQVLEPLAKGLFFFTGNYPQSAIFSPKIHLINIKHSSKNRSIQIRATRFVISHLKLSYHLIKAANKIDVVVFVGMASLLLPTLTARLLGKRTVYIDIGSIANTIEQEYKDTFFGFGLIRIFGFLEKLQYKLSEQVVVYSPRCIEHKFLKYKNKISAVPRQFLNFNKFAPRKQLKERKNVVGYVGRFESDKGILNFIEAIPLILRLASNTMFLVGGDGQLRGTVERYVTRKKLNDKVMLPRWISRDDLPKHLNELKLLVLPSYVEGLPNIMLEAMACGTPVVATSVGGILDVIKDGETGFILEDNSPETIAKGVIRALNHPNLKEIALNARALVERRYTYEAAVERYRNLLVRQFPKTECNEEVEIL